MIRIRNLQRRFTTLVECLYTKHKQKKKKDDKNTEDEHKDDLDSLIADCTKLLTNTPEDLNHDEPESILSTVDLHNHCIDMVNGLVVLCVMELESNNEMNTCDQHIVTPSPKIDLFIKVWLSVVNTHIGKTDNDGNETTIHSFWLDIIFDFFNDESWFDNVDFSQTIGISRNKNVFVYKTLILFRILALNSSAGDEFVPIHKDSLDKILTILHNIVLYFDKYQLNRLCSFIYNGKALWRSHSKHIYPRMYHLRGMMKTLSKQKKQRKNTPKTSKTNNSIELNRMKLEKDSEIDKIVKLNVKNCKLLMKSFYCMFCYALVFLKVFFVIYFGGNAKRGKIKRKMFGYYIFLSKIEINHKLMIKMKQEFNLTISLKNKFTKVLIHIFRMIIDANMMISTTSSGNNITQQNKFWNYNMEPGIDQSDLNTNKTVLNDGICQTLMNLCNDMGRISHRLFFKDNFMSKFGQIDSDRDSNSKVDENNNATDTFSSSLHLDFLTFDVFSYLIYLWKDDLLRIKNDSKYPLLEWQNGIISSKNSNNKHDKNQVDSDLTMIQYYQKFSKKNKVKYENKIDKNDRNNNNNDDDDTTFFTSSQAEAWKYESFLIRFEMKYIILVYKNYRNKNRLFNNIIENILFDETQTILGLIFKFIGDWQIFHKVFGIKLLSDYVKIFAKNNNVIQYTPFILNVCKD